MARTRDDDLSRLDEATRAGWLYYVAGNTQEEIAAKLGTRRRRGRALGQLVAAEVPYGRMGTAEDLPGMAIFLASAESDYVVAQTYNVDGGDWMS